jgi:hypothetical protein
MRSILGGLGAACLAIGVATSAQAASVVRTVDGSVLTNGYMNVSDLPANGGAYQFGSSWGIPDLRADVSASSVTLKANAVGDPSSYWYTPSGGPGATGNKIMDANLYTDTPAGIANGDTLTFTGNVISNTMVAGYTATAFIKDFAPDYSSNITTAVPLTPGVFSITVTTDPGAGRHIQYGFEMIGANAWITDADAKGSVVINAIVAPEPASLTALGAAGLLLGRRRRA